MKQSRLAGAVGLGLAMVFASGVASAEGPDPNRVWVKYKQPGQREAVRQALKGGNAQVHFEFDELNAFVATLPAQALQALRNNPNIASLEPDLARYPSAQSVPYGIDLVQARDAWDFNRDGVVDAGAATGAGIKVCVIDSGINASHEDFAGIAMTGYPTGWNTDTCGHGTHVAGTIAAANNSSGVVGVSPGKVSLHVVKVFGTNGYSGDGQCSWTYSSTLVDAANRCASAGAKIISMSLGGPSASTTESNAFQGHYNNGILNIAAAGNDGNSALSYPAGYPSVVSVAAVDQNKAHAAFSQFNSKVELAAPGVAVHSTFPLLDDPLKVGNSNFVAIPVSGSRQANASAGWVNGGLCTSSSSTWRNKIVLCQRGTNSFYQKVQAVQSGRGVGVVIYNNVAGALTATLGANTAGTPYHSTIPAVGISQADGQAIVASLAGQVATVDTVPQASNNSYVDMDGTSMATPHVSGVAAVVWSAKPTATNLQVRDALAVTAQDIDAAGRDNNTGWGLVQTQAAITELLSQ